MKVKNILTGIVFDLPKKEVENLISEYPNIYEKFSKRKTKKTMDISSKINNSYISTTTKTLTTHLPPNLPPHLSPNFEQNTILPLIWEE